MDYSLQLSAGVPSTLPAAGSYVLIEDTGAAASIAVELRSGSQKLEAVNAAKRGHKFRVMVGGFDTVILTSAVDALVKLIVSNGIVDLDLFNGSSVDATIQGLPLAVTNDRGSPGNPIYISGMIPGQGSATAVNNVAAVAVDAAGEALLAANANRARAVFTNLDAANPVAIGAPGITWANRAIVLQPGDTWIEERAGNLAWSAICAAGQTATVGVQEVLA